MRIVTVTIAIEDDPTEEADRSWDKAAKAARQVAKEVTQMGLPSPHGGQMSLDCGAGVRAYVSTIRLPKVR